MMIPSKIKSHVILHRRGFIPTETGLSRRTWSVFVRHPPLKWIESKKIFRPLQSQGDFSRPVNPELETIFLVKYQWFHLHLFICERKNIEIYFRENLEKQFSSRIFDENIILNNRNWIRKMLNPRCFKLFCEFCDFCVSTFKHDRPCSKNEILENLGKYSNSTLQSVSFKKTSNKYFYATFFNPFMTHKLWCVRL